MCDLEVLSVRNLWPQQGVVGAFFYVKMSFCGIYGRFVLGGIDAIFIDARILGALFIPAHDYW